MYECIIFLVSPHNTRKSFSAMNHVQPSFLKWNAYQKCLARFKNEFSFYFFKRHAPAFKKLKCDVFAVLLALEYMEEEEHQTDAEEEDRRGGKLYEEDDWFSMWRKLVGTFVETFSFSIFCEIVEEKGKYDKNGNNFSFRDVRTGILKAVHERHRVLCASLGKN